MNQTELDDVSKYWTVIEAAKRVAEFYTATPMIPELTEDELGTLHEHLYILSVAVARIEAEW
jgi:hypothetical protein